MCIRDRFYTSQHPKLQLHIIIKQRCRITSFIANCVVSMDGIFQKEIWIWTLGPSSICAFFDVFMIAWTHGIKMGQFLNFCLIILLNDYEITLMNFITIIVNCQRRISLKILKCWILHQNFIICVILGTRQNGLIRGCVGATATRIGWAGWQWLVAVVVFRCPQRNGQKRFVRNGVWACRLGWLFDLNDVTLILFKYNDTCKACINCFM